MQDTERSGKVRELGDVRASIRTDPGCLRGSNEDHGRHVSPGDRDTIARRGRLTVIADGMGGHSSGEVASRMAVEIITQRYYSDRGWASYEVLRRAIEEANREIYGAAFANESLAGMGTTVVALVMIADRAFSAHVGDSRLYRMRGGRLALLTRDHSQVMEMVQQGLLTVEQARSHDDKNVILRALGPQAEVEVELSDGFAVEPDDTFLLCSDGLNDMVEDDEIEAILRSEPDEHQAADLLIAAAKANGGHDNVTVGIVRVGIEETAPSPQVRITRELEAL